VKEALKEEARRQEGKLLAKVFSDTLLDLHALSLLLYLQMVFHDGSCTVTTSNGSEWNGFAHLSG
jgi:hypothetical protein